MTEVSTTPFAEPSYLRGLPSPYYTPAHRRFQKACREFLWEHLLRHAMDWERQSTVPEHVFETFCQHNMLLPNLPAPLPVGWLKRLGIHDVLGVKVEDWDYMYTGIYCDELARSGLAGPGASLNAGFAFGIPPIIKYGSEELQERFLPELLTGKKRACIAITEPEAGSDVANLTTTAKKTPDGKHYIVNGSKKWYDSATDSVLETSLTIQDHQRHLVRLHYHGCPHGWPRSCWAVGPVGTAERLSWRHHASIKRGWTEDRWHHVH